MSPPLPEALDPRWISVLDRIAPGLLRDADRQGAALVAAVRRASELYTRERARMADVPVAARLRFFLPRDLPKVQGPLAPLVAAGALPDDHWRVLDVGAGLGTTSLGIAALARRAGVGGVEVRAIERDAATRSLLPAIARAATEAELVAPLTLNAQALDLEARTVGRHVGSGHHLIVVGLVLNELFVDRDDAVDRRVALLESLVETLAPGGALIVLEPALRDVTRELMGVRDAIQAGDRVVVEAPCPTRAPCPMLPRERDWCHAQLPFALPEPLATVARGAGLRFERLTYAYLTLRRRKDARPTSSHLRVVGGPVRSKGKVEWTLCAGDRLVRLRRMERERAPSNEALEGAARGTLLDVEALRTSPELSALRARPDVPIRAVSPAAAHRGMPETPK